MSFAGKKVLVTGAGGFIGSHLAERLVRDGAEVRAFVRYTSRAEPGLLTLVPDDVRTSMEIIAGDLRDPHAVEGAVDGCEAVFHLGAVISIPYSYVHPFEVADVNVTGTVNVLAAARRAGARRVVHTSTSEVYGTAQTGRIAEDHPKVGQSPYSASKIGADALAHSFFRSFELPVVTVRPFNTYGPRQSGRAIIPTIIGQALHRDVVELGSLTPTRDLTFVADTVAGFLAAAECDALLGREVNLGNGREISIGELAERIVERVGREVEIVSTDARKRPEKSEVFRLNCDATLAKETAGWEPKVSLDEGLDAVIAFMREHPEWTDVARYQV